MTVDKEKKNELKEQIIDAIDGLCPDKSAQGSKDYIEFLIDQYTAKKELEARLDGRRIQAQATLDKWNETDPSAEYTFGTFLAAQVDGFVYELTQLSSQLTNNKEGIEK